MSRKDPNDIQGPPAQERIARWALLGIGALLTFIAIFTDPVGDSPTWGIAIGVPATRMLLGILGGAFLVAGALSMLNKVSK